MCRYGAVGRNGAMLAYKFVGADRFFYTSVVLERYCTFRLGYLRHLASFERRAFAHSVHAGIRIFRSTEILATTGCRKYRNARCAGSVVQVIALPAVSVVCHLPNQHAVPRQSGIPACALTVLDVIDRLRRCSGQQFVAACNLIAVAIFGGELNVLEVVLRQQLGRQPTEIILVVDRIVRGRHAVVVVRAGIHQRPFTRRTPFFGVGAVLGIVIIRQTYHVAVLMQGSTHRIGV